jgi:N-acetylglucosaminyldiphosphoundecaprenol N-acetyl-beta-D-mannosaminyltransferase
MTPPDYIEDLVLACEKNNVSLFFLGGQAGIVDNAINQFLEIAPNLKIQGHPGHFEISGEENDAVIQQLINLNQIFSTWVLGCRYRNVGFWTIWIE